MRVEPKLLVFVLPLLVLLARFAGALPSAGSTTEPAIVASASADPAPTFEDRAHEAPEGELVQRAANDLHAVDAPLEKHATELDLEQRLKELDVTDGPQGLSVRVRSEGGMRELSP